VRPRHSAEGVCRERQKVLKKKLCGEVVQGLHKVTCDSSTTNLYNGMGLDEIRLDDRVVSRLLGHVVATDCCSASTFSERTEPFQSNGEVLDDRVVSSLPAKVAVSSSDDCCIVDKSLERTESCCCVGDNQVEVTGMTAINPDMSRGVNVDDSVRENVDVSGSAIGGNSSVTNEMISQSVEQSWVYTWVLAPRS